MTELRWIYDRRTIEDTSPHGQKAASPTLLSEVTSAEQWQARICTTASMHSTSNRWRGDNGQIASARPGSVPTETRIVSSAREERPSAE